MRCTPHRKRGKGKARGGGQTGPTSDGVLRIVTDLLDVPAEVVAFLYQYRWTIEVFFRFLKQILGCRHLLSTRREGVQIQIYAAVICCLLLNTLTGAQADQVDGDADGPVPAGPGDGAGRAARTEPGRTTPA